MAEKDVPDTPPPPADDAVASRLKDACIRAAFELITDHGTERLSLEGVARHLGVADDAPLQHFGDRDHLLVEVIRRSYQIFAEVLDDDPRPADPWQDLAELGRRYLRFAATHPVEYRLMFGTPWPPVAHQLGLAEDATHAFDVMHSAMKKAQSGHSRLRGQVDLDALFIWSCVHGLATLQQSDIMRHLPLEPRDASQVTLHMLQRLGAAMLAPVGAAG